MLVTDVMTAPVVTLEPGRPVRYAVDVLHDRGVNAAPVVADGRLVGIVTRTDLLRAAFGHNPRATALVPAEPGGDDARRVADVMSTHVLSVPVGADVAKAAELMKDAGVNGVPVMDGDRVAGIVTRGDLLGALVRTAGDG